MKKRYYVNNNPQSNGDHEVHVEGCRYMPANKKDLGEFYSCKPAVDEATKTYTKSNGCKTCCNDCHTS